LLFFFQYEIERILEGLRVQLAKVERERKDMEREQLATVQRLRDELDAKTHESRVSLERGKRKYRDLEERLNTTLSGEWEI